MLRSQHLGWGKMVQLGKGIAEGIGKAVYQIEESPAVATGVQFQVGSFTQLWAFLQGITILLRIKWMGP